VQEKNVVNSVGDDSISSPLLATVGSDWLSLGLPSGEQHKPSS